MSRTRKNKPGSFRKNSRGWTHTCPRHGACSWCDRDRQHQKLLAEQNAELDLEEGLDWRDRSAHDAVFPYSCCEECGV